MNGTTTGKETFEEAAKYVAEIRLPWEKSRGINDSWCASDVR